MPTPVIAIFDIGKTNKKLILFDEKYKLIREQSRQFEETKDENGNACENINAVGGWIRESIASLHAEEDIHVRAFNVSAYGASFVHLDTQFKVLTPLYNYLNPYPENLKTKFYETYGGELAVSMETASPVLGNLNSGLQLYRLKYEQPGVFEAIHYSLHLPQYISHLITSMTYSDITSIGCHTHLWDFKKNRYHDWVFAENINIKLPPLLKCDSVVYVGSSINSGGIPVGGGLHDSSAALIPYLMTFQEPFILISTGTWCISLNPFNQSPLTEEELKKDCLCYLTFQGRPVKASRIFAGNDHELQTRRIAGHFNKQKDFYKSINYNPAVVSSLLKLAGIKTSEGQKQSVTNVDSCGFELRDLTSFSSCEEAYHQLMIDIITLQTASTGLVIRSTEVRRILVDGGFSKNPIYMNLLASAFPNLEVFGATIAQSTSMGAALAIHKEWNSMPVPGDIIELKYYARPQD